MPIRVCSCLSLRWCTWRDKGADPWVVEVLRWGYQIPFSSPPPLSLDPIPSSAIPRPPSRESSFRGGSLSHRQRSGRSCSSLPWVLQSLVRCLEDVGFVASGDRPLPPERVCASDSVRDGDQPVGSPCNSEARLDGLHRPEGCAPSGSCSSREQKVSSVCGFREGLSVQGPLLRSVHGPSGLHQGNGSWLVSSKPWRPNPLLFV